MAKLAINVNNRSAILSTSIPCATIFGGLQRGADSF